MQELRWWLGSDATIETADIVIQDDKPPKLPPPLSLEKKQTYRMAKYRGICGAPCSQLVLWISYDVGSGFCGM